MSITRITGLTSGLDTDSMIKELMEIEKTKIDSVDKQKSYLEWEQEAYRDVINSLRAFQDEYFDYLSPDTNLRSATAFGEFSESVKVDGEEVSYISVKGTPGINNYNHTITSISQIATKDEWTTDSTGIGNLSSNPIPVGALPDEMEFSLSIDDNTKIITVDTSAVTTKEELVSAIDAVIQEKFGSDYAGVVNADPIEDAISFRLDGSEITIMETEGHSGDLSLLGFDSGESTNDYKEKSIADLLGVTTADMSTMEINGVTLDDLGINVGSTLSELTDAINSNSDINVTLNYSTTTDKFTLLSNDEGSANAIDMSAEFMGKLGFVDDASHHEDAKNAIMELDGTTVIKSSNNFKIDGIQYEVNDTYDGADGAIDIVVENDTDAVREKIEAFVETYNGLIETISGKIEEVRNYDYEPLTDEEKDALSEEEIERWELRAKAGLLHGDSTLSKLLTDMRTAIYESVEGVDLTLSDLGIQTSSSYEDGGKLVIDDDKFTEALESNFEDIVDIFTSESEYEYMDSDHIGERYQENGIANRIHDLLQNNIRLVRDSNGSKGALLEKAGMEGDTSFSDNMLSEQIEDYESKIERLWDLYYDKENAYYIQFGNMESALAEMQAQSSSLASMLA